MRALLDAKARENLHPELVTCDFSASLIAAAGAVFGEDVIGIDGFHVMQELNNGIRRDLLDFRSRQFTGEICELFGLRDWVHHIQDLATGGMAIPLAVTTAGAPPTIDACHASSHASWQFTTSLVDLLKVPEPLPFFRALADFLERIEKQGNDRERSFVKEVQSWIPKARYTSKGMNRVQLTMLKKLKVLYLGYRAGLNEESQRFYKDHWILFFQPERMTSPRRARLDQFLARYPQLRVYREMTVQVGEIYRLPAGDIDGHQVTSLRERPEFSSKWNTAIRTIKDHAPQVLRFVEVFKRNPGLPKRCRANMEWYNHRFKTPFKAGNNLVKKDRLMARLRLQLRGSVEWQIEVVKVH